MAPEGTYFPLPRRSFADLPDVLEDLTKRGVTALDVAVALEDPRHGDRWGSALYLLGNSLIQASRQRHRGNRNASRGLQAAIGPLRHGATSLIGGVLTKELASLCETLREPAELRIPSAQTDCVEDLGLALGTLSAALERGLPPEVLGFCGSKDGIIGAQRCRRLVQAIGVLGTAPDFVRFYLSGWLPSTDGNLREPSRTWLALASKVSRGHVMASCLLPAAFHLGPAGRPVVALALADSAEKLSPSCLHAPLLAALLGYELGLSSKGAAALERWYERYWCTRGEGGTTLFVEAFENTAGRWRAVARENRALRQQLACAPADLASAIERALE